MESTETYQEDILHQGFENLTIPLMDDYEGHAVATLVRRLCENPDGKAVLYIHGFNDYFFQTELAFRFNENGYNFYALDLRKYGRSYRPNQKFNDIRNLKDYYEEIDKALHIIHNESNPHVVLFGHSTGGLIVSLYAKDRTGKHLFEKVILNSPFFEFNLSPLLKLIIKIIAFAGKKFPQIKIKGGFSHEYGKSIHHTGFGEWDYSLQWKPHVAPSVTLGWINAIYRGQQELKRDFSLSEPVLILHSESSVTNFSDRKQMHTRDAVLNVKDIDHMAHNIKGDVTIGKIKGGLHDLILSRKVVREDVYTHIFDWLNRNQKIK